MVANGAFSHKIDYVTIFQEILNPEGHPNCITGTKVTGSFIGKGLRLQPAQQLCLLTNKGWCKKPRPYENITNANLKIPHRNK